MPIKIGSTAIKDVRVGTTKIKEVRVGSTLIWVNKTAFQEEVEKHDLELWWEFAETSGSTVADSSEYDNELSVVGADLGQDGPVGSAIHFDGSDDYAYMPDEPDSGAFTGGSGTIYFWMRDDSNRNSDFYIFDREGGDGGDSGEQRVYLWYDSSKDEFEFWDQDINIATFPGSDIPTGQWVQVAITFDTEDSGGAYRMYVDKSQIWFEDTNPGVITFKPILAARHSIDSFYGGAMDEFIIFSEQLTSSELDDLYDAANS